jgi:phage tail P2-like protein
MSLLPAYMGDAWKCYETMSREDRSLIDPTLINASPELCHVSLLPFLAWEADVDVSGISQAMSRKVIRAAFDTMKYAGTARALIGPVEALSDTVKVVEWFEYAGEPFNFRVEINASESGLSSALITKLEKTCAKQKNARSVLENIKISMLSRATMTHAATLQSGEIATVYPYFPEPIEISMVQYLGASYHTVDTTTIYPQGA